MHMSARTKNIKDPAVSAHEMTEISYPGRALGKVRGTRGLRVRRVPKSSILVECDAQQADVDVGERFGKRSLRLMSSGRLRGSTGSHTVKK